MSEKRYAQILVAPASLSLWTWQVLVRNCSDKKVICQLLPPMDQKFTSSREDAITLAKHACRWLEIETP